MKPHRHSPETDQSTKLRLLELLLGSGSLRLGQFQTKTGRISPYFFNVGCVASGKDLAELSEIYGNTIARAWPHTDCLFGSAYKGIPLVSAIAVALHPTIRGIRFAYNRKEQKSHGEGGSLVGAELGPPRKVVVIDDVLTGGVSLEEAIKNVRSTGAEVLGALVAIDRQEKSHASSKSAKSWIETSLGVPVISLITVDEIIEILEQRDVLGKSWMTPELHMAIKNYRKVYGGT
jgi:orotate phosphoribosyltransferase